MGYSKKIKMKILKHVDLGITPIESIAKIRKIPKKIIYRWLERRKHHDEAGLENLRPGAKEIQINTTFERLILALWHQRQRSSHKIWLNLKDIGFLVSERQIQKIYRKHTLKMSKRSRPSQIKFVKYEWPKPNALWHTDWTICPYTGKQLIAFVMSRAASTPG